MRCLVTGSQGTLGRPLVQELRDRGHVVVGCDLKHDADEHYDRADVAEYRQLLEVFTRSRPHVVYHLAAEFGRLNGEEYTEQLWRTAMVGTRNVLELCNEFGARLIFASSSEVYGNLDVDPLTETDTDIFMPLHPNEYALSKWTNERQILAYRKRHPDLRVTVLRFFNAYGPGEAYTPYRSVVALFAHKALTGQKLPVYQGYNRTFMYIDDFIPTLATVAEVEDPKHDVYNIGGTDYRSVEELAHMVLNEAGGGEMELIPQDRHNVRDKRPDILRAQQDFGHNPTVTLDTGVPLTVEWLAGRGATPKVKVESP